MLLLDTDMLLVESRQLTESGLQSNDFAFGEITGCQPQLPEAVDCLVQPLGSSMVPLEFGNHPFGIDTIFLQGRKKSIFLISSVARRRVSKIPQRCFHCGLLLPAQSASAAPCRQVDQNRQKSLDSAVTCRHQAYRIVEPGVRLTYLHRQFQRSFRVSHQPDNCRCAASFLQVKAGRILDPLYFRIQP